MEALERFVMVLVLLSLFTFVMVQIIKAGKKKK